MNDQGALVTKSIYMEGVQVLGVPDIHVSGGTFRSERDFEPLIVHLSLDNAALRPAMRPMIRQSRIAQEPIRQAP